MINNIAVILGGHSSERAISLKSGEAIWKSLVRNGYKAFKVDPQDPDFTKSLQDQKPDLAFIALHGSGGEDGSMQGFLETMNIPYTGSGVLASALAMNKIYTQTILRSNQIKVPPFMTLTEKDLAKKGLDGLIEEIRGSFGFPALVKAPSQGSTLGIHFINKTDVPIEEQLTYALKEAFQLEKTILIEKMITPSTEITIGILGNDDPYPLPTLEITTVSGYYDYTSKYTKGLCEHIIPARLPASVRNKAKDLAVQVYKCLGCRGFARADFMIQGEDAYMIDINTIPGFTEMSLLPDAAKAIGISFDQLTQYIVEMAQGKEFPSSVFSDFRYE